MWLAAAIGLGVAALAGMVLRQGRKEDLPGKTVLITGGSRGLGLLLARRFAAEGGRVALCARDRDSLERARQDLIARGAAPDQVFVHSCDVTDPAQIAATVRATEQYFNGPVDILVNNAGTIQVGPAETMTQADYEEAFATHFWAAYHFVEVVLPHMRARRSGRIVNISSIGGIVSVPHLLPYSASKSALVGYSEGLRAELLKDNIYVTTVCPGLIRTGSPRNAFFKGQNEKEYAWFALSDSLPGSSMSADAAADEILNAVRSGDAFLVTSLAAQAAALLHGVFPGMTADLMGAANQLLPGAGGGIGTARRTGAQSETSLTQSVLTGLTQKAAADNNQLSSCS
ncbi:MAG: SDR family NAD(P)-dependent oxidoreductase [Akkermansiaceae bacterium]|nr:SDR family NAD(P)-dependent oxidoreductase [Armatimonadota bacterium]